MKRKENQESWKIKKFAKVKYKEKTLNSKPQKLGESGMLETISGNWKKSRNKTNLNPKR